MKGFIINIEIGNHEIGNHEIGNHEIGNYENHNYYIKQIGYLLYDFETCKVLIIQSFDINLYYKAHEIFHNNIENKYQNNRYENNRYENNRYENNRYENNRYENNRYKNNEELMINNKLKRVISIINYYILMSNIIISNDYELTRQILINESNKNNIICEINNKNIDKYCLLKIYNKIFYKNIENDKDGEIMYEMYERLFKLNYLFKRMHTLLNCLLIIRIYYKYVTSKDIEKYDYSIKRLRICNS